MRKDLKEYILRGCFIMFREIRHNFYKGAFLNDKI